MNAQLWTISAQIKGNFFLVAHEIIEVKEPIHPNVKGLIIDPEFDDKGEQTGIFNLKIDYLIEIDDKIMSLEQPANIGRDIFDMYINLLTFLSGSPIKYQKLSLTYKDNNTNEQKQLIFNQESIYLPSAVPILGQSILSNKLDHTKDKILVWLRKGIEEKDIINSLLALYVSLEILSEQFPCHEIRSRTCEKCGHENEMQPGTRQKVQNLLINIAGYNQEKFESIWDNTRNKIIHGGIHINAKSKSDLSIVRSEITVAIIKGVKKLLNISPNDPPSEEPPNIVIGDSFLVISSDDTKTNSPLEKS